MGLLGGRPAGNLSAGTIARVWGNGGLGARISATIQPDNKTPPIHRRKPTNDEWKRHTAQQYCIERSQPRADVGSTNDERMRYASFSQGTWTEPVVSAWGKSGGVHEGMRSPSGEMEIELRPRQRLRSNIH